MHKLTNLNSQKVQFDDFTNWFDCEEYGFIWNGKLYRTTRCFRYVICICDGELYEPDNLLGETITPVELVNIDYLPVQKR